MKNYFIFLNDQNMSFKVQVLEGGKMPTKAHSGDAGWDLYAAHSVDILPSKRVLVSTECKFNIPQGYYGRIADRSGLALKSGLHVMGGVIDSTYTGVVKVVLVNLGDTTYSVSAGEKIAQMIITKIHEGDLVLVENLDEFTRGENGFGSSGKC